MSAISKWISQIKLSIKAHKWIWAAGGAAGLILIVLAALYFFGVFGPSGRAVCKASIERVKDYGILPSSAEQDGSAKSTNIAGRKTCAAADGADKFVVTVEVKCKDLKKDDCLSIYGVEREDGLSLYQVRAVPNDADDAAAPPAPGGEAAADPGAAPAAAPASSAPEGTVDTDVEVAHPAADGQAAPQP